MNQYFYTTRIENGFAILDEEESRHLVSVLRKKVGDPLQVTDGLGNLYEVELSEIGKKQTLAQIHSKTFIPLERKHRLHMGVAPTKNIERFEWFLEKATEIGIDEITPLLCKHSERDTIRLDRLEKILVSAMKQSLRTRLPKLNPLTRFQTFATETKAGCKCIGWCADVPLTPLQKAIAPEQTVLIAIGPEGDFSPDEIASAHKQGFHGINLGPARLRTETAAIMAVVIANQAMSTNHNS